MIPRAVQMESRAPTAPAPQDHRNQSTLAIQNVFNSCMAEKARAPQNAKHRCSKRHEEVSDFEMGI
eukprot:1434595-Rhodomonas_salina.3